MSRAEHIASLADAFPVVRAWLEHGPVAETKPPRTAACELAEIFRLDAFGRNILLLCAYVALEPDGRDIVARLLDDPLTSAPTLSLALTRLPGAHWKGLSAEAPLRRAGLVRIEGSGSLVDARLRLADTVLLRLVGAPSLDAGASALLRRIPRPLSLAPNRATLAREIGSRLSLPDTPVLHLTGGDPEGKLCAFAEASAGINAITYALNSQLLPQTAVELVDFAAGLTRDMMLCAGRLVLMHDDMGETRTAQLFAETYGGPLAIASVEPMRVGHRLALRLEMLRLKASEQLAVWHSVLSDDDTDLIPALPRLAATFCVAPEVARAVAAEMSLESNRDPKHLATCAWEACRRTARPRMDDLAHRVASPATWDDLILAPRQKDVLESIIAQVRNRTQVYEEWGFGVRLQHKGLGVSALFSGPSGAGKSMAGEVIGNALDLDVYRVDLSAMVSKWVGETEKNLRRVFDAAEDGGVILQFDEADALFGRRSEVKDSHDRHANIEVSYLLQRLEAYRGLCILTTNMRDNIDDAFLRRLRFIVDFRFPNLAERRAIWMRIFPDAQPREQLDYDKLAQLNLAGGSIRNIALGAAFLAADRGCAVSMAEILQAAQLEYDKVGRPMTDAERAGWLQ
ncbi:ATP-binding protein [Ensifer sp. ENS04]|uniref:AAA family ATPase n=1 Tax=Ensifer sp. ENS04 TaxID=2769281 RepID=UPI00177E5CAA|nr:ATP-binding protein [Ensifer sp. ENS04]